jgi:acetyl-CoA carboxylase carboxyl transferase subunit beta
MEKILPENGKNAKMNIPEGLWSKCPECSRVLYQEELERLSYVCPKSSHHLRISARKRLEIFLDSDNQLEIAANIKSVDPLKIKDQKKYKDRYSDAQKRTKENDALLAKSGFLNGMPIVAAAFDFNFMGGSMGSAVGEKFVRASDTAIENKQPFVCFSASGGARMQEGLFSLMQMSKTSLAVKLLADKKIPFISVLTDPTMGGVSAICTSPNSAKLAETPPIVGSVKTEINGIFLSANSLTASDVLDICISEKRPSCILAPPLAEKHTKGCLFSIAVSEARTNFSPTAEPIEPPMKLKSKAAATIGIPFKNPDLASNASFSFVLF